MENVVANVLNESVDPEVDTRSTKQITCQNVFWRNKFLALRKELDVILEGNVDDEGLPSASHSTVHEDDIEGETSMSTPGNCFFPNRGARSDVHVLASPNTNSLHEERALDLISKPLFQELLPSPFASIDRDNPVAFLRAVRRVLTLQNLPHKTFLLMLFSKLKGRARDWFSNCYETIDSHETFFKLFEKQFITPSYIREINNKIEKAFQGKGESLAAFIDRLADLYALLLLPVSEGEIIYQMIAKFRPTYASHFIDKEFPTVQSLREMAVKYDALEHKRMYEFPTSPVQGNVYRPQQFNRNVQFDYRDSHQFSRSHPERFNNNRRNQIDYNRQAPEQHTQRGHVNRNSGVHERQNGFHTQGRNAGHLNWESAETQEQ